MTTPNAQSAPARAARPIEAVARETLPPMPPRASAALARLKLADT